MRDQILQTWFPDLRYHSEPAVAATYAIPQANRGKQPIWMTVLNLLGLVRMREESTREVVAVTPTSLIHTVVSVENPDQPECRGVNVYPLGEIQGGQVAPGKNQSTVIKFQHGGNEVTLNVWSNLMMGNGVEMPEQGAYQQMYPELQKMTKEVSATISQR